MEKLKVLDLFSGIGGFSLGFERTGGFETVAFCEIEEFPQKILKKHWPDVPIYNDVRTLEYDGPVDIICGGFPCTQTSIAAAISGNRTGLEGKDSARWYDYLRIVRTKRPLWVIVENPGGVKKWESEITSGLEGLGYTVSILVLKASDCGYPHRRGRYFYVSNLNGQRLALARQTGSPTSSWFKRLAAAGGDWLATTPGIVGRFNGVSDRVDRVKCLGNTVMPDKTEMIGHAILEAEFQNRSQL